jgi:hypothetical protein
MQGMLDSDYWEARAAQVAARAEAADDPALRATFNRLAATYREFARKSAEPATTWEVVFED